MSGTGKSVWSGRLAECGFTHYSCDRLIADRLAGQLQGGNGCHMIQLGEWLGFPFDPGYEAREAEYLATETAVLTEVVERLERTSHSPDDHVVIDSTGSVIYVDRTLLARLRQCTTIIYLSVPIEFQEALCRQYVSSPRPVLWRGMFNRRPGETGPQALARCYPHLLASRQKRYEQLADVTIEHARHSASDFSAARLIEAARAHRQQG